MTLMQRLKKVLSVHFDGAEVSLKYYRPGSRIGGSLVWDGFQGKDQLDRQIALRHAINDGLPPDERADVSFILTLTPHEAAAVAARD